MVRIPVALASLALLSGMAHAQPAAPATPQQDTSKQETAKPGGEAATPTGTSDFADQQTYKMKDGGMYQPPGQRPASPAQDLAIYGRT